MKKLIVLAALVAGSYSVMNAQVVVSDKDGWHKIGETKADFKTETDEIAVMGADKFSAVKLKVTDAPINLMSFDIYFENDEKQNVRMGQEIKNPGETRVVQINGGERRIKKVVFMYKTVMNKKDEKAHVELWGLKTNVDKKTDDKKKMEK